VVVQVGHWLSRLGKTSAERTLMLVSRLALGRMG
jgi:hypothetical protein